MDKEDKPRINKVLWPSINPQSDQDWQLTSYFRAAPPYWMGSK